MASPLLIFNVKQAVEPMPGIVLYYVCVEQMNMHFEKAAYSIASMVFQYIVPIVIVTVAHARICNKLKYRMINQNVSHASSAPVNPFLKRKNGKRGSPEEEDQHVAGHDRRDLHSVMAASQRLQHHGRFQLPAPARH